MKHTMLFVALLSVTSLFATEETAQLQVSNAELQAVKAESTQVKVELANAKREVANAKTEIATKKHEMAKTKRELAKIKEEEKTLTKNKTMHISVIGQGVAPMNTTSPAQAYALAKRAAIADAYRGIAEKVKGVRIDGQDLIKNMMVKRSVIRTGVKAMVRNANVVETTFKEGLCEVEMEIVISYSDFAQ